VGSSFENFTLALHKLCKYRKKIKAQTLKYWLKNGMPERLPVLYERAKGPQSFAHWVSS